MQLNPRQNDVLEWIADGCPERDWPDWTHRSTAKALQSRGLVKVRGHGTAWTAVITDLGRRVLTGDRDLPTPGTRRRPARQQSGGKRSSSQNRLDAATPVHVDPANLIAELDAATEHILRVSEPDRATRAGYRRALAAIPLDLIPDGMRVTYTGRDRGDLVIRYEEQLEPTSPGPTVLVPVELDENRPLIEWLADHPDALGVAPDSVGRALRIIQGLENTLTSLGHTVSTPRTAPPNEANQGERRTASQRATDRSTAPVTFEVTVMGQTLQVSLFEETTKVHEVAEDDAARLKYEWQRATPVETWKFSGRLALRIHGHAPKQGWADRQRWTLESRLPRFVAALVEVAEARAEARHRALEAQRERRRQWEEAIPKARAAYLSELNRTRLTTQLDAFTRAQQLRGYADAVTARAAYLEGEEQEAALAWAEWIRADADRRDPALQDDTLRFVEPAEIRSWELDKHMPRGWSAARPPD